MHQCITVNTTAHFRPTPHAGDNTGMYKQLQAGNTPIARSLATLMERVQISSATALSKLTKLPQPTISRILNGSTKDPETPTVRILADFFGVTEAQMRGIDPLPGQGDGQMPHAQANTEPGPDIVGRVPLISWVQAGAWCEIIDNFAPGDAEEWIPCPVSHSEHTFVLRVRGESMFNPYGRPSFMDGDLIFVDPERPAQHGSLVVVRLDDDKEATFKKLVIEGERKYLKALNPAWPEPMMEINGNATICGVVIFKGEKM